MPTNEQVPNELLEVIIHQLSDVNDLRHAAHVCRQWRAAFFSASDAYKPKNRNLLQKAGLAAIRANDSERLGYLLRLGFDPSQPIDHMVRIVVDDSLYVRREASFLNFSIFLFALNRVSFDKAPLILSMLIRYGADPKLDDSYHGDETSSYPDHAPTQRKATHTLTSIHSAPGATFTACVLMIEKALFDGKNMQYIERIFQAVHAGDAKKLLQNMLADTEIESQCYKGLAYMLTREHTAPLRESAALQELLNSSPERQCTLL